MHIKMIEDNQPNSIVIENVEKWIKAKVLARGRATARDREKEGKAHWISNANLNWMRTRIEFKALFFFASEQQNYFPLCHWLCAIWFSLFLYFTQKKWTIRNIIFYWKKYEYVVLSSLNWRNNWGRKSLYWNWNACCLCALSSDIMCRYQNAVILV